MKITTDPRLPLETNNLVRRLTDLIRDIAQQVNGISEGKAAASYNAQTAAPTTGLHAQGDLIRNSTPTELGSAPNRYVILGWLCVSGGEPGTWVPLRVPTE